MIENYPIIILTYNIHPRTFQLHLNHTKKIRSKYS